MNANAFASLGIAEEFQAAKQAWQSVPSVAGVVDTLENLWQAVHHAMETYSKEESERMQCAWIREFLLTDYKFLEHEKVVAWFLRKLGTPAFAEILGTCFDNRIMEAARWMPQTAPKCVRVPLKTIGLYYMRMYNGGVERVLSKLIPMFMQHGYQVVLFTDIVDTEREYLLPKGVHRVVLGKGLPIRMRCERILSGLQKYHVDVYCCHACGGRMLYELFCVQQAGVPVVLELHNVFSALPEFLGRNSLALCHHTDALVTLSRVDAMFWRLRGCRSLYIPNPVDSPEDVTETYDAHTILWLHRMEQVQKQVFELPDILSDVVEQIPDAKLVIVGASDTKGIEEKLKCMFEERGLANHVVFEGFQTDVERYYRKAAVFLMTSAYEGFPMTVAECKKYGVPLVLYDLPYLELLKDRKGYVAVAQRDKKAAARELVRILKHPDWRQKLSAEAQQSLASFYKINLMAAWEKAFSVAMNWKDRGVWSEKEKIFSEIEDLLLDVAERERVNAEMMRFNQKF